MSVLRIMILAAALLVTLRTSFSLMQAPPPRTPVAAPGAAVQAGASDSHSSEDEAADRRLTGSPAKRRWRDFGIAFPSEPIVTDLPANEFVQAAQQFAAEDEGRAYRVIRMELRTELSRVPAKAELFADGFVQGFKKFGRVELLAAEVTKHRMRECLFKNAYEEHIRARIYLAGGRVFAVMVGAIDRSALFGKTADQFLDSFEID